MLVVFWLARRNQELEPVPPNPFVSRATLERVDDWQPVGDSIELEFNSGCYVSAALTPAKDLPKMYEGREVQPPERWSVTLVFYRRGDDAESADALRRPCIPLKRARPGRGVVSVSAGAGFIPNGNTHPYGPSGRPKGGQPEPPKTWPEDELRYWTYFGPRPDEAGEYVYELTLFPAAAWISAVRFDVGPPVVLMRGVVRIGDEETT